MNIFSGIDLNILVLFELSHLGTGTAITISGNMIKHGFPIADDSSLNTCLKNMIKDTLIEQNGEFFSLTDYGKHQASIVAKALHKAITQSVDSLDFHIECDANYVLPSEIEEMVIIPLNLGESTMKEISQNALLKGEDNVIKAIQRDYFWDALLKKVDFSDSKLPIYEYQTRGVRAEKGTLLFFRVKGLIIASAILDYVDRNEKRIFLEENSVRTFVPISEGDLRKILNDDNFTFKRTKQRIASEYYQRLKEKL